MIAGERPEECSYCWRVEDNNDSTIFSDRIYKSHIYSIEDTMKLKELPHFSDYCTWAIVPIRGDLNNKNSEPTFGSGSEVMEGYTKEDYILFGDRK
jgi:hypothetical protein